MLPEPDLQLDFWSNAIAGCAGGTGFHNIGMCEAAEARCAASRHADGANRRPNQCEEAPVRNELGPGAPLNNLDLRGHRATLSRNWQGSIKHRPYLPQSVANMS